MTPRAGFVVDAGLEVGGGHLARCQTLAAALAARGWRCRIVAPRGSDKVRLTALAAGVELVELSVVELARPASVREALAARRDCIIVDHYGLGAAFERALAEFTPLRVVLDDRPVRPHVAEVLIDATPLRAAEDYAAWVEPATRLLLGTGYALVRAEFAGAREKLCAARSAPEGSRPRLFVSVGAADTRGITEAVLDALMEIPARVDVVLGRASPNLAAVAARVRDRPGSVLHVSPVVDDMIELMGADLAVGGAGTSAWERCAVGLPSVVIVVADNQRDNAAALAASGAARVVDFRRKGAPGELRSAVSSLLAAPVARRRMSESATRLCDGLGADRVADELHRLVTVERTKLS